MKHKDLTWETLAGLGRDLSADVTSESARQSCRELHSELVADPTLFGSANRRLVVATYLALSAASVPLLTTDIYRSNGAAGLDYRVRFLLEPQGQTSDYQSLVVLVMDAFEQPELWPWVNAAFSAADISVESVVREAWISEFPVLGAWVFVPHELISAVQLGWRLQVLDSSLPKGPFQPSSEVSSDAMLVAGSSSRRYAAESVCRGVNVTAETSIGSLSADRDLLAAAFSICQGRRPSDDELAVMETVCGDIGKQEGREIKIGILSEAAVAASW